MKARLFLQAISELTFKTQLFCSLVSGFQYIDMRQSEFGRGWRNLISVPHPEAINTCESLGLFAVFLGTESLRHYPLFSSVLKAAKKS